MSRERSDAAERFARPGAHMRVTQERLLPIGTTGIFILLGLATFAFIPVWTWLQAEVLAAGWIRHPGIVVLVHLYALGWGTAVALGALKQLGVVLFQAPRPVSAKARTTSLILFGLGFLLFVIGTAIFARVVAATGGALMLIAVLAVIFSVAYSALSGERRSVVVIFAVPAVLSLFGVAAVGTFITWQYAFGIAPHLWEGAFLLHLLLGPLGWFGFLIPGVTYELGPFFGLTRDGDDKGLGRWHTWVLALLLLGYILLLVGALRRAIHPLYLLPLAAGFLLFVYDMKGVFRSRSANRQSAILTGVRFAHGYLIAMAILLIGAALVPGLWSNPRWAMLFGFVAAGGWVSNSVAAYLHRILPFILWHNRYWGKPKEEVKTRFPAMVDQTLGRRGFHIYNVGVGVVGLSMAFGWDWAIRPGILFLALGTWALVYNLGRSYAR